MNLRQLFLFIPIILITLSLSCKGPSGPDVPKNPREYTWTVDTLAYPGSFQTMMRDIWASSPSDVYVVGHNERGFGKMFHFDGKNWKPVGLNPVEGGTIADPIDLSGIHGFSQNNIFAVGKHIYTNPNPPPNNLDSSLIIHFDGRQWREQSIQKQRGLWSISNGNPNNLWACGYDGALYHYDGLSWKKDSMEIKTPSGGESILWHIKQAFDETYVLGTAYRYDIVRTTHYFFRRKNNNWSLVDSFYIEAGHTQVKFGQYGFWTSPQGTLYSFGPHIFRWEGSSWTKIYDFFDALRRMVGTSDNNIFAVGDFGNILHFNGTDWYLYQALKNTNVVYSSVWTDGKEVFVVGYFNDGSKTLVLHGK